MIDKNSPDSNLEQSDLQNDPIIKRFLADVPAEVYETFTDTQLLEIRNLFLHKINNSSDVDIRLSLPFLKHKFYLVFLMGKERRSLQRLKKSKFKVINPYIAMIYIVSTISILFMANLYIIQNQWKIDAFPYSQVEKLKNSWK
jgi:hypothetical protein